MSESVLVLNINKHIIKDEMVLSLVKTIRERLKRRIRIMIWSINHKRVIITPSI